jgi:hypothetical protein
MKWDRTGHCRFGHDPCESGKPAATSSGGRPIDIDIDIGIGIGIGIGIALPRPTVGRSSARQYIAAARTRCAGLSAATERCGKTPLRKSHRQAPRFSGTNRGR